MNHMHKDHYKHWSLIFGLFILLVIKPAEILGESEPIDAIIRDATVVAPGLGSDGILVSEDIEAVLKRLGRAKFKVSKPRNTGELFADVFKISSKKKIFFQSMYYNDESKFAACVFQGKVVAVIGFDNKHITTESVNLRSGVNSFIFYYGNRNLYIIKSDSNGIYLYPGRGIAVVDDGMNDSIDLYIIFAADSSAVK